VPARGQGFTPLRQRLQKLQHMDGLPDVLGVAAVKLVADCFREERDPYGKAWRPLSYRRGRILRKTSRMFNSTAYSASPRRVRVSITAWYSIIHQEGARVRRPKNPARGRATQQQRVGEIPKRAMVPDDRGMPAEWDRVFQRDTTDFLDRIGAVD
jgi:phage gpG-like protein